MSPAIHIKSRSWLRSSSTHEPSDPPLRVIFSFYRMRRATVDSIGSTLTQSDTQLYQATNDNNTRPGDRLGRTESRRASSVGGRRRARRRRTIHLGQRRQDGSESASARRARTAVFRRFFEPRVAPWRRAGRLPSRSSAQRWAPPFVRRRPSRPRRSGPRERTAPTASGLGTRTLRMGRLH